MTRAPKQGTENQSTNMQVELPPAFDIATRGTLPASYGRPTFSTSNRTRNLYTRSRKGSPGASRGSPRASQKRATSGAVKTPSPLGEEEQGAHSSGLQPTARSSTTATTVQGSGYHSKSRYNSNTSSKSHNYHQQQG